MKDLIITVLIVIIATLLVATNYLNTRVDDARDYINVLEADYPEYIDTTSGTDAYVEWYKYRN